MGNMEWNQTLPGQGSNSVTEDVDDGYALAVSYPNAFGLVKINATGFVQQNQTYVAQGDIAEARSIILVDDGGYAIAGWTQ